MSIYAVETTITLHATIYVRAENQYEANRIARNDASIVMQQTRDRQTHDNILRDHYSRGSVRPHIEAWDIASPHITNPIGTIRS